MPVVMLNVKHLLEHEIILLLYGSQRIAILDKIPTDPLPEKQRCPMNGGIGTKNAKKKTPLYEIITQQRF